MTKLQKFNGVIIGFLMIALSALMIYDKDFGFVTVCLIISLMLFVLGVKSLIYYFRMARHMVGGRRMLYKGVILFDFGIFTLTLNDIPVIYIILYLVTIHAFAGTVDLLNAIEAMKLETSAWKIRILFAIGNLAMAILCLYYGFFRHSVESVVYVYAAGLLYNGLLRIINSFRKTEVIYIQ